MVRLVDRPVVDIAILPIGLVVAFLGVLLLGQDRQPRLRAKALGGGYSGLVPLRSKRCSLLRGNLDVDKRDRRDTRLMTDADRPGGTQHRGGDPHQNQSADHDEADKRRAQPQYQG